jgi:hypothetical protein
MATSVWAKRIGLAGALAALLPAPIAAQGVFDMGVLTNTTTIPTRAGPSRSAPIRRAPGAFTPGESAITALSGPLGGRAQPAAADVRLTYTPTAALRRKAVDGYISRMRREYPEAAQVMAAQLAQHDYSRIYSTLMRGAGLRDNDAADAVVAYTLLGWQIAKQDPAEISTAKVQAVRRQIAPALAANPRLSGPAARADLGEEMKLLFVTLHAGWQSAQKEGNTRQYSDGVARMFQAQSGRDLRALNLTTAGFSRG